ncbi:hypothetical protein LO762_23055 [Actinocorallia sp. API 0066]|uniref:hypothetical protein n=1 Tax=Actinocorallia sp. API 0066 TaxID=2896846 RepID=UPI001E47410A|nr:hypothetical protein [Actinocorallia sp. API 0066]MCD0452048.1 hypothetical protein [Actinocorallia sp. API 0066]
MPRSRLLAVAAVASLALAGCAGTEPSGGPAPEPSAPADSPSAPAATAGPGTPPPTGTAAASAAAIGFADAKEAVTRLIQARINNDKTDALKAAGPRTVEKVFSVPAPSSPDVEGCNPGADSGVSYAYDCYWRYEGGSTHYYVDPYPATGWRVVNYTQVAD